VHDAVVQIGASLWVYAYEASRPDATVSAQGVVTQRACSRTGVLPWTNLTYDEAKAACAASDMALCTVAQWLDACDGPANNCAYSYSAPGGSVCLTNDNGYPSDRNACNGHNVTAAAGSPDTDALAATGAYARCFVQHPATPTITGGELYDLSGNAKEWTQGPSSPAENPLRGGSYNNLPSGLRCKFDFALSPKDVKVKNIGFRCCSTTAP
jgi:formylglycine-generating enzyme required for sulfatase activity